MGAQWFRRGLWNCWKRAADSGAASKTWNLKLNAKDNNQLAFAA